MPDDTDQPIDPDDATIDPDDSSEEAIGESIGEATPPAIDATAGGVRPFDCRQSGVLSLQQTRALKQRHQDFARSWADRVTLQLRCEFKLKLRHVELKRFAALRDSLPEISHIAMFKLEPLRGICLAEAGTALALGLVERLLGGTGSKLADARELTEIETALFDQVIQSMLEDWAEHWPEYVEMTPSLLGHETSPRFLQTCRPEASMVVAEFEAHFGELTDTLRIAFPYGTLEPVLVRLKPLADSRPSNDEQRIRERVPWRAIFDDVKTPVTAHWQGLEMSVRELSQLNPGDVIELPPLLAEKVEIRVGGACQYLGRLGTQGRRWAIEILERHPDNTD